MIFLLHRIMTEDSEQSYPTLSQRAAAAGREKLPEIMSIYEAMSSELKGDKFWRYHKCISPGIQEFIEALSFLHYLDNGNLVTFRETQRNLSNDQGVPVRAREPKDCSVCLNLLDSILIYLWKTTSSVYPT